MTAVSIARGSDVAEIEAHPSLPKSVWMQSLIPFAFVCALVEWPAWTSTPIYAIGSMLASMSVFSVALIVWPYVNLRPFAIGCIGAAFAWSLQWFTLWDTMFFPVLGILVNTFFYIFGGIGILRTPNNVKRQRFDYVLFASFFLISLAQFVMITFSKPEWHGFSADVWWPSIWPGHLQYMISVYFVDTLCVLAATGFCVANVRHAREMKTMDRLVAVPVLIGFCTVGVLAGLTSMFEMFPPVRQDGLFFFQSLIVFFIPSGLVGSWARRSFRRALLTEQLSRRLSRQVLTGDVVRDQFRELLGDPTIELFYWSEQDEEYVDTTGVAARIAAIDSKGFVAYLTNADAKPIAVVTSEATVLDHRAMLESFLAASALAIENVQLQAGIKAQLEQVRASRARIVEATLEERRRIERDLHDGVQQRLLAIQARIGIEKRNFPGQLAASLSELSTELSAALTSLRELARGIHPPELRQFGLRGAIEVVAERLPVNVEIEMQSVRLEWAIESTLYFVICEALSNIVKHADAKQVQVQIVETSEGLLVQIDDDGVGGAIIRPGGGLEGLADRLRTLGAELKLGTNSYGGATLRSLVPR